MSIMSKKHMEFELKDWRNIYTDVPVDWLGLPKDELKKYYNTLDLIHFNYEPEIAQKKMMEYQRTILEQRNAKIAALRQDQAMNEIFYDLSAIQRQMLQCPKCFQVLEKPTDNSEPKCNKQFCLYMTNSIDTPFATEESIMKGIDEMSDEFRDRHDK